MQKSRWKRWKSRIAFIMVFTLVMQYCVIPSNFLSEVVNADTKVVTEETQDVKTDEAKNTEEVKEEEKKTEEETQKPEAETEKEVKQETETEKTVQTEFTAETKAVTVKAEVSKDAFSEDVKLVVKPLEKKSDEYKDAADKLKKEKVDYDGMMAYDIHFENSEGKEIEPGSAVKVEMEVKKGALIGKDADKVDTDAIQITHIHGKKVENVADSTKKTDGDVKVDEKKGAIDKVKTSFEVKNFSTITITWKDAADNDQSATIHYVTSDGDGNYTELTEPVFVDTSDSTGSISLNNNFDGYSCYGAVYKETADAEDSTNIGLQLYKTDNGWEMEKFVSEGESTTTQKAPVANGSHIYVVYGEHQEHGSSEDNPEVQGPTTEKTVTINDDNTATIRLDITAPVVHTEDKVGANVIVILDTTTSMSYGMNSTQNVTAPRNQMRIEAARSALNILVNSLDMNTNDINFALAEFNLNGSTHTWGQGSWTKNPDTILGYVNGRTGGGGYQLDYTTATSGTNWEIGLRQGQGLLTQAETLEDLKDNKTYVIFVTDGEPNRWVGYPARWNNDYTHVAEAVQNAQDEANNVASRSEFYGVFCGNSTGAQNLATLVTVAGEPASHNINARSRDAIEQAFDDIAHTIISDLGSSNVSVDDGVTQLSSVSAQVAGTASGFRYYKNNQKWEGAPAASFSDDNGVTWDLSSVGTLENNATYSVEFDIWPSQEAYDLIADLNNGLKEYSELDEDVKNQINDNGDGTYSLNTNTHLKTTYTFNGDTYTDNSPWDEEVLSLDTETIAVKKEWVGTPTVNEIDMDVKKDDDLYLTGDHAVKLTKDNNWERDDIYISCGFITIDDDGKVDVKETGHEYKLVEPEGFTWQWDLHSDVYRPMVINGTTTMLVLDEEVEIPAGTDDPGYFEKEGKGYYVMDGKAYRVDNTSNTLTAHNYRKSNLNLTKTVTGTGAPADALFEYTVKISEDPDEEIWVSLRDENNQKVLNGDETYIDAEGIQQQEGDSGYYYFPANEGNGTITVKIKAGWNFRVLNLSKGVKYEIEETGMPDGFEFVEGTSDPDDDHSTWTAKKVEGTIAEYNKSYTETYENRYATTSFKATKIWDDASDQDGIRTALADFDKNITLYANGEEYEYDEADLSITKDGDNYVIEFTNLPKYMDGEEVTYTLKETTVPEGYELIYDEDDDSVDCVVNNGTFTNKHEPEETEATVIKVWDDDDDNDGKRPETLEVTLKGDNKTVTTVTLSEENDWTKKVENLPKKNAGVDIVYTWTEGNMPEGYSLTDTSIDGTVTTFTNSYTPEETAATVIKVWDDNGDQDGKRPETLSVTLLADGKTVDTVTLSEDNSWTETVSNLPKYSDKKEIEYIWDESSVPDGYELISNNTEGTVTTLTNQHVPEKTEASVKKVWDDNEDQDGKRPDEITVTLSNGTDVTLSEANGWTKTITDLDKYKDGKEIEYTWTEKSVPEGYTLTGNTSQGTLTTITNTHEPEKVDVSVKKVWYDNDDQDGKRPESITVTCSSGDEVTLSEDNNWTAEIKDLDKYKDGKEIKYTWDETSVPEGYELTQNKTEGYVTTLKNTHEPEKTEIEGTKTWEDNNDQDGKRPTSITVNLLADGEKVASKKVTAKDDWKFKFTGLDKYKAGKEIEYTISEDEITDYTTEINQDEYNIINIHEPEKTKIDGKKIWKDRDNKDGKRPDSITVNLLANGKKVDSKVVTADDDWAYEFTDLDKYSKGKKIEYTVTEDTVPGYKCTVDGTDLINTEIIPEKTEVKGKKVWKDNNDKDKLRPDSITVNLLANGKKVDSKVVTAEDNWKFAFKDLDKKSKGKDIKYTVTEEPVKGYTTQIKGTKIINTHSSVPKTGDTTNMIYVIVLIGAAAILGATFVTKRRRADK